MIIRTVLFCAVCVLQLCTVISAQLKEKLLMLRMVMSAASHGIVI